MTMSNTMAFNGYESNLRRGCGALIINERSEVLLVRRGSGSRNDVGQWSQPGGAIDPTLPPEASVHREIMEEIGVKITLSSFLTTTHHWDKSGPWLAYSYLATLLEGTPGLLEPRKHDSLGWFPLEDLPHPLNLVTQDSVHAYRRLLASQDDSIEGLVVFDMDGTLLPDTMANLELARALGQEPRIIDLERGYSSGVLDSTAYAQAVLEMYSQLTPDIINKAFHAAPKLNGLRDIVDWCHRMGLRTAVITTGPEFFARGFVTHYGVDDVRAAFFPLDATSLRLDDCLLVHDVDKPVLAKQLCDKYGVHISRCIVVGDSRSDVSLFQAFPQSVALNFSSALEGQARYYLRTSCILDLIPAIETLLSHRTERGREE